MSSQKKEIVIEVDPLMATTTIGLIKGIFQVLLSNWNRRVIINFNLARLMK